MRVKLNITPRCQLEFDAATPKEAIKLLSAFGEIFTESACGLCKSTAIKHEHRNVDGNDYYNLRCSECGAELAFGQHKTGDTLFVKRDKNPESRGWYHFRKET